MENALESHDGRSRDCKAAASLTSAEILRIARLDAEQAYRDLTPYRIRLLLEADGWHVDYVLKNPKLNAGGPH